MLLEEVVRRSRSCRRFYEDYQITAETLKGLVNLARLSPSAANLQPLKYILSFEPSRNGLVFPALSWAGYLKDWPGPEKGERPSAYIVILGDKSISKSFDCDSGIASQSILLGAAEKGLAGCIIGLLDKDLLRKNLGIAQQYEIVLAIALGKPKEKVVIDEIALSGIKYFRDADGTHHVPKRPLDEIILT